MSVWSHLPNAYHIDRIIESVKSHPEIWDTSTDTAWSAAHNKAWYATTDAAREESWYAATDTAWDVATDTAWDAARGPIAALIAYDDASKYLDMPVDQLRVWAILSEEPAAILLIPAVIAFERISELECV